jgi:replicative DNA helicase
MSQLNLDLYEKVIVYNCLKTGNEEYLASVVDYLEPELFTNVDAAIVVQIIREFYLANNQIPNRTEIAAKITNRTIQDSFKRLINEFKSLDKEYSLSELVRNTETFIKQRSLLKNIETSLEEYSSNKQIDEERALKEFDKIQAVSLVENLGMDFFEDTPEFIKKLSQSELYISTGYTWLDRELGGGLFKEGKSIYGIAGETNVGKSIVLGNIATNVLLQNYNVAIITLEMSEFRYAKRLASMLSGITQSDLSLKTDEYSEFVVKHMKDNNARMFIKEFPTKQVSPKHVAGYLKKLERKRGFIPNLIVLDYHTLLKPSIAQGSKHADMQFVTQESRALSYIFECPVITAAQLNRSDGTITGPDLNRIAGSWDMLSDLDYLVNIWQTDEDREAELIRWMIKKARDSERNNQHFWNIDYSTLRLLDEESFDNNLNVEKEQNIMLNIIDDLGF